MPWHDARAVDAVHWLRSRLWLPALAVSLALAQPVPPYAGLKTLPTSLAMTDRRRLLFVGVHVELAHFSIEIGAVHPESLRGAAHIALTAMDVFLDELDLKLTGGVGQ